jgi:imidazolonepropionase-like amidohydrolase
MRLIALPAVVLSLSLLIPHASAQEKQPTYILIQNVKIFDGVNDKLTPGHVLIENNLIKQVGAIQTAPKGTKVIDGGGRTLMPGLMDAHVHLALVRRPKEIRNDYDWMYVGALAGDQAKKMLLRGFTTVRDIGGPTVGLARVIDEGYIAGPRIFSSGPYITQTSGHGDFRNYNEMHPSITGDVSLMERQGWLIMADGPDQVRRATREALRYGAKQIKMMAGGGVSSPYDPLHTLQGSPAEFRAAVEAAKAWDTYVAVHAYTDEAVRMAVEAGVKSIEHGPFLSDKTMQLMAEKGVFLAPTARISLTPPEKVGLSPSSLTARKLREVNEGAKFQLRLAKKYGVKIVYSTDQFGAPENFPEQSKEFLTLAEHFSNVEVLRMATSNVADLLKLSGKLNPYQDGQLGVVKEGAYADLLLVDGNPLDDVTILAEYEKNIQLIMKDGKVYKNTLN